MVAIETAVPISVVLTEVVVPAAVVEADTRTVSAMAGPITVIMREMPEDGVTEVAVHAIRVITTAGKTISQKAPEVCMLFQHKCLLN